MMESQLRNREDKLEHQLMVVADVIAHHGDAYWPVYDCLEGELKRVKSRRRKLGRRFLHHLPSKK